MGSYLGKPMKVYSMTLHVAQGKFAHVYIEVNLKKPLIAKLHILDHTEHLNESLVTLILKQESLQLIFQFRPIALCYVVVKCITKILANKLKPLMAKLAGETLCSFFLGDKEWMI